MSSRREKLRQHLPGLLIEYPTAGNDPAYQKKRNQVSQAIRNNDPKFKSIFDRLDFALNELDIYFDEKGNLSTKRRH